MWILVWMFMSYSGDLSVQIPHASVESVVMSSQSMCEDALAHRLDVNDTRYMIAHDHARLLCVQVPGPELPDPPQVWALENQAGDTCWASHDWASIRDAAKVNYHGWRWIADLSDIPITNISECSFAGDDFQHSK